MRTRPLSLVAAWLSLVAASSVEATPLRAGSGASGLPGVDRSMTATPAIAGSWLLMSGARYGWTPDVLAEGDSWQRGFGRLGLAYSPWAFLTAAITLEGSVDSYLWPAPASDSLVVGALGDPRLSLRTGWHVGGGVSVGGAFELWVPSGRGSFTIDGDTISPTVTLLASFAPERIPIGLHLNVGYRHDRSLGMLGDLTGILPEQLVMSGATSSRDNLALRLGIEYRIGPAAPFVELDASLPFADMARTQALVGVGARLWLGPSDEVQLSLAGEFRATPAPPSPVPAASTVWQATPLVTVFFSVAFRVPVARVTTTGELADQDRPDRDRTVTAAPAPPGRVAGHLRCADQTCGPGARIAVRDSGASPFAPDDETGRYTTASLPPGTYVVEASAPGHDTATEQVEVRASETTATDFVLAVSAGAERPGIRGRVTDFEGQPVQAVIRIPVLGLELTCDAAGRFETEVDPGRYEVVVSAQGFATQQSRVEVTPAGVVVMNIELRRR